jgi:hypothetical protein
MELHIDKLRSISFGSLRAGGGIAYKQIGAANQWFKLSYRNIDIVSKIFLLTRGCPRYTPCRIW